MKYQRYYFENAALCGECTGHGCKWCGASGIETFAEFKNHEKTDLIFARIEYNACVRELTKNQ